jgi:DNA-directed RNA polymerase subunit RPC12/RpoP
MVNQAQQKVGEVAEQVQEKAGEVAGQVREQAATRLSSQKDQAAGRLWTVAWAFRSVGDNLREQDEPQIAQITDKVAEQVERATSYLGHRDINQIANDVQRFARRQPALFLGGAMALGFLGARFLKSSSRAATSSDYGQSQQTGADFNCPECGLRLLPADYERENARCPRCGTSIGLREYYQSQAGATTATGSSAATDYDAGIGLYGRCYGGRLNRLLWFGGFLRA